MNRNAREELMKYSYILSGMVSVLNDACYNASAIKVGEISRKIRELVESDIAEENSRNEEIRRFALGGIDFEEDSKA